MGAATHPEWPPDEHRRTPANAQVNGRFCTFPQVTESGPVDLQDRRPAPLLPTHPKSHSWIATLRPTCDTIISVP